MSQSLVDRYQKVIGDLKENRRIEIVHLKWKPAVMNEAGIKYIKAFIEKNFKEPVPDLFFQAGTVSNNTHVCWRGNWNERTYWGEFFLPSPLDLYREPAGGIAIEKSFGGNLTYSKKISVIDSHPEIGDMQATLLDRASSGLPLWLYYKGRAYAMALSYLKYLELLCATRGIAPWPFHFADYASDDENAPSIRERLAGATEALRFFFPDADLSIFHNL